MRASVLLVIALLGFVASQNTVFTSNVDVRASLSAANNNAETRAWLALNALGTVTAIGARSTAQQDQNGGSASGSVAWVFSHPPLALSGLPFSVNWAFYSANANGNNNTGAFNADVSAVYTSFRVWGYVVYTDSNGNGVYDQGEETSLNTFRAGLFADTDVSKSSDSSKPSNYLVTHANADSSAKMRYLLANKDVTSQGEFNQAENAKIDFWFQPKYTSKDGPNARVALVTTYLAAQASVSVGGSVTSNGAHVSGRGDVSFSAGGVTAKLGWTPTAAALDSNGAKSTVDLKSQVLELDLSKGVSFKAGVNFNGNSASAEVTVGAGAAGEQFKVAKLLLFSFQKDRPTELYWDPSLGQSNSGQAKVASVAVLLACFVLAFF